MYNGKKRRRETTKVWEVFIQWKNGSYTWNQVKDVKEFLPVQLAEYAVLNQISDEPEFVWRIKKVTKKRERIISKTAINIGKRCTSTDCASHIQPRKTLR